jgi:hypothetical protein
MWPLDTTGRRHSRRTQRPRRYDSTHYLALGFRATSGHETDDVSLKFQLLSRDAHYVGYGFGYYSRSRALIPGSHALALLSRTLAQGGRSTA